MTLGDILKLYKPVDSSLWVPNLYPNSCAVFDTSLVGSWKQTGSGAERLC